jgi:hypothetical protein
MARKPPVWLKAGDQLVIEIEGLGRLENHVVDEADLSASRLTSASGALAGAGTRR